MHDLQITDLFTSKNYSRSSTFVFLMVIVSFTRTSWASCPKTSKLLVLVASLVRGWAFIFLPLKMPGVTAIVTPSYVILPSLTSDCHLYNSWNEFRTLKISILSIQFFFCLVYWNHFLHCDKPLSLSSSSFRTVTSLYPAMNWSIVWSPATIIWHFHVAMLFAITLSQRPYLRATDKIMSPSNPYRYEPINSICQMYGAELIGLLAPSVVLYCWAWFQRGCMLCSAIRHWCQYWTPLVSSNGVSSNDISSNFT